LYLLAVRKAPAGRIGVEDSLKGCKYMGARWHGKKGGAKKSNLFLRKKRRAKKQVEEKKGVGDLKGEVDVKRNSEKKAQK